MCEQREPRLNQKNIYTAVFICGRWNVNCKLDALDPKSLAIEFQDQYTTVGNSPIEPELYIPARQALLYYLSR
jgi:hypothetical protein